MKSTLPTQREIRIQGGLYREDSVCFLMSSKLACPEWNNSTLFYRVGDSEMMRIRGTSWSILPSFKIMYYYLQRLRILIWLSLLSFSKTEAKSGKLCFLFKSTVKVPTHMCLQCLISVTLKIRDEPCQWGPVVIVLHLPWEGWVLWLLRRCTYPHLVTRVKSSLSDGTHSSLRCCAIHASGGVSRAITEGLWGTDTHLLCFSSWSRI